MPKKFRRRLDEALEEGRTGRLWREERERERERERKERRERLRAPELEPEPESSFSLILSPLPQPQPQTQSPKSRRYATATTQQFHPVSHPIRGRQPQPPPPARPLAGQGSPLSRRPRDGRPKMRRVKRYYKVPDTFVVRDGWNLTPEIEEVYRDGKLLDLFPDGWEDWFEAEDGTEFSTEATGKTIPMAGGRVIDIPEVSASGVVMTASGQHEIYKKPKVKQLPKIIIYETEEPE
tara:strand:+ start:73 stop:780 length:708 start_codon:yes stop_codon:yes gene_type:complete